MRSLPIYFFGNALSEALLLYAKKDVLIMDCFCTFELVYFTYFLSHFIMSQWVRKTMLTLAVLYVGSILYASYADIRAYTHFWFYVVEPFIVIFPCLFYFREILIQRKSLDLFRDPSFWMVLGIIYYFLLAIPTLLFTMYFLVHAMPEMSSKIYATNIFSQIISYSLFMYAMQCSKRRPAKFFSEKRKSKNYFPETNINTAG